MGGCHLKRLVRKAIEETMFDPILERSKRSAMGCAGSEDSRPRKYLVQSCRMVCLEVLSNSKEASMTRADLGRGRELGDDFRGLWICL